MKKKTSIVKNVTDFLRSNAATTEICQKIIGKCEEWIVKNKQKEIEEIDKQISELQKLKDSLQ